MLLKLTEIETTGLDEKKEPINVNVNFVDELIRGIGHDIGAPARHIVHFSKILKESCDSDTDEEHKHCLDLIESSGRHLQDMLAKLAQFSSLSTHAHKHVQIDLKAMLDEHLEYHRKNLACTKPIYLTVSDHWLPFVGSHIHWNTLISSLIENAIKFQPLSSDHSKSTPDRPVEIHIHLTANENTLTLTVEDNGIGIKESQLRDITRPFKRLNHIKDYPGLGMGLAYCKYIAELNNATLTFDKSKLGGLIVVYTQPNNNKSNENSNLKHS